jgi:hypothetical protein
MELSNLMVTKNRSCSAGLPVIPSWSHSGELTARRPQLESLMRDRSIALREWQIVLLFVNLLSPLSALCLFRQSGSDRLTRSRRRGRCGGTRHCRSAGPARDASNRWGVAQSSTRGFAVGLHHLSLVRARWRPETLTLACGCGLTSAA